MAFQKAVRTAIKSRIALMGPTNGGKTYSALLLAYGSVKASLEAKGLKPTDEEIWSKIAVSGTERGRALAYANRNDLPFPTGTFLYDQIEPPYDPDKIIRTAESIVEVIGEDGVWVIDSLSHFWAGRGGLLEQKADIDAKGGNQYTNWAKPSRKQDEMVDTVLNIPCDLIVTMRSKMDTVIEENEQGKKVPKQLGLKAVQKGDLEYEFDIVLMLDKKTHCFQIIKDTTFLRTHLEDLEFSKDPITPLLGEQIKKFLQQGTDPKELEEEQRLNIIQELKSMVKENSGLAAWYKAQFPNTKTDDLTFKQAKETLNKFNELK